MNPPAQVTRARTRDERIGLATPAGKSPNPPRGIPAHASKLAAVPAASSLFCLLLLLSSCSIFTSSSDSQSTPPPSPTRGPSHELANPRDIADSLIPDREATRPFTRPLPNPPNPELPQNKNNRDRTNSDSLRASTTEPPRFIQGTHLLGLPVKNAAGQWLGQIADLMFDLPSGRIEFALIVSSISNQPPKTIAVPIYALTPAPNRQYLLLPADQRLLYLAQPYNPLSPQISTNLWGSAPSTK